MSKKKYFSLSTDEHSILHFIWRVKVATTAAVFLRFEKSFNWKECTAYKRLLILTKKGCLDTRSDNSGRCRAWSLTPKGFKAIQHILLPLKEEGFGSESVAHDLHVLAAHFGEWIRKGSTPDVHFVTEQELRRIDDIELPRWAEPLLSHKPDGAWYFPETVAKSLYVLEVELSRKRNNEYQALGAFYSEEKSISSVLWVVQNKGHINTISSAFRSATSRFRNIHNFVLLEDFRKFGWASVIVVGPNAGISIRNFLENARRQQSIRTPSATHQHVDAAKLLDLRICRFNSNTSAPAQNSKIRA